MKGLVPARTLTGHVVALLAGATAARPFGFRTHQVEALDLSFEGIANDRHGGLTRRSGGREPWYPRGTQMRNERQLSLVSPDELAGLAADMELDRLDPGWLGANLVIEGLPDLTLIPPRSRLFLEGGATLYVDGLNVPCRQAGRSIAEASGRPEAETSFVTHGRYRRGLVAFVEKPGTVVTGARVEARIAEHWLYPPPPSS
jgi:hypothetical protein